MGILSLKNENNTLKNNKNNKNNNTLKNNKNNNFFKVKNLIFFYELF